MAPGVTGSEPSLLRRAAVWLGVRLAAAAAVLAVAAAIGLWITYLVLTPRHFDKAEVAAINRVPGITYLDAYGALLATRGAYHGEPVTVATLPPYLPKAFIATEDRRFYSHWGVDPRGIARAMFANWRAGHLVQGGSTITQQLAKNLFLNSDRTANRKIREMFYAVWLERHLTKDEILELYLNRIYMGAGNYGVGAAADYYFNKPASKVSLAEAAMLAGLPKAPSKLAPTSNLESATARADSVLVNLVEAGYVRKGLVTAEDIVQARETPASLTLTGRAKLEGLQYFFDTVHESLPALLEQAAAAAALRGETLSHHPDDDLVITTTLDTRLQQKAEAAILPWILGRPEVLDKGGAVVKEAEPARGAELGVAQGALIAYGPDGAVRAMVGGRSYTDSQFNRATQAMRQPGSSFKPFVYVAALENGFTPDTVMEDRPVKIGTWEPTNYAGGYVGRVTLAQALAGSINTVAAQLIEKVGPETVVEVSHRLGIKSSLPPVYSLALGSAQVSLEELTGAFIPFAAEGIAPERHFILKIVSASGDVLYEYMPSEPARVMDEAVAHDMTAMMHQVIQSGTGRKARLAGGRPAAGKTGTSQDWRDAWFIGYTPGLVAGVWFGNDDESAMNRVTGGGLPAQVWKDFMDAAHVGVKIAPLPGTDRLSDRKGAGELAGFYRDLISDFRAVRGAGPPPAASGTAEPRENRPPPEKRRGGFKWPWEK